MTLRLSTEFNQCHSISDHNNNLLACISTNTPGLPEKMVERFNAFEDGGLVGELVEALNYLLEQTVNQDLNHGITLTEGEVDAMNTALEALAKAKEARHA